MRSISSVLPGNARGALWDRSFRYRDAAQPRLDRLLGNPDVWAAMSGLREKGLTESTGSAPGPANGFAIDMAYCIEHFHEEISSR